MERVYRALLLFATVLLVGALLFRRVEGFEWFDAFYTALLSVTPIGHGLIPPLSRGGRQVNAFLLVCGVGVVGYVASIATRFVFEGEMGRIFWIRKVQRHVENMNGHYILCGHGRVGRIVAEELAHRKVSFVVVEKNENAVAERIALREDVILGDATDESVLESAGVRRAAGLVAALQSDADNLYITLSAREMNPDIRIVARSTDDAAAAKLKRAGASRTVSPNIIGGREMAQHLLIPAVVDFIHLATGKKSLDLEMQEVHVAAGSRLSGMPISESSIRREHGVIVVAINKPSGESIFNPGTDCVVGADDTLICLGRPEQLAVIRGLAEAAQ
jgi:voltage-gated potassium channel